MRISTTAARRYRSGVDLIRQRLDQRQIESQPELHEELKQIITDDVNWTFRDLRGAEFGSSPRSLVLSCWLAVELAENGWGMIPPASALSSFHRDQNIHYVPGNKTIDPEQSPEKYVRPVDILPAVVKASISTVFSRLEAQNYQSFIVAPFAQNYPMLNEYNPAVFGSLSVVSQDRFGPSDLALFAFLAQQISTRINFNILGFRPGAVNP
ncbi:MAG: hypothetical protein HQ564_06135 [Candidatus Saganbacteria bacterium]|nr:hypothetical protein [Candidatus Saganbacteria bacterium]